MNVAFIFLECEVSNNLYSIQGMDNAYVTRFLYSPSRMALVLLDSTSFHCFPDQNPVHAAAWSECYSRTIWLIGGSASIGIHKPEPRLGDVSTTKTNDVVYVLSRVYVDVSYSKVRVRLHAYQHILVVDNNNNIFF